MLRGTSGSNPSGMDARKSSKFKIVPFLPKDTLVMSLYWYQILINNPRRHHIVRPFHSQTSGITEDRNLDRYAIGPTLSYKCSWLQWMEIWIKGSWWYQSWMNYCNIMDPWLAHANGTGTNIDAVSSIIIKRRQFYPIIYFLNVFLFFLYIDSIFYSSASIHVGCPYWVA